MNLGGKRLKYKPDERQEIGPLCETRGQPMRGRFQGLMFRLPPLANHFNACVNRHVHYYEYIGHDTWYHGKVRGASV